MKNLLVTTLFATVTLRVVSSVYWLHHDFTQYRQLLTYAVVGGVALVFPHNGYVVSTSLQNQLNRAK